MYKCFDISQLIPLVQLYKLKNQNIIFDGMNVISQHSNLHHDICISIKRKFHFFSSFGENLLYKYCINNIQRWLNQIK